LKPRPGRGWCGAGGWTRFGAALQIDPEAFAGRDPELLADLILAAVAEAQRRAADLVQAEMRKVQDSPVFPAT
jgi:DNA-binding protein YbaB